MHRKFTVSPTIRTEGDCPPPGIVIHGRRSTGTGTGPRIQAFIYGGKIPAAPHLDYGRRKGAA